MALRPARTWPRRWRGRLLRSGTMRRPLFALATLLCGSLPALAEPGHGAVRWVYETLGPEAPAQERFEIDAEAVRWFDPQGRTQWHYARSSGTLTHLDHTLRRYRQFDAAGVRALAQALQQAAQAAPPLAGRPPWAALDGATPGAAAAAVQQVAGVACRQYILHASPGPVGSTCMAETTVLAGGAALRQMLTALHQLALDVRPPQAPGGAALWPLHPLVVAVSSPGVPLQVVAAPAGGVQRELRLQPLQTLHPQATQGHAGAMPPPGYRAARAND